jgi:serine/threonine protein kinase/tetratricopeptide (TPR) repeat protein
MSDQRTAKDVFAQALERPASERPAFVAQACGRDEALRAKVMRLLVTHEQGSDFLSSPTELLAPGRRDPLVEDAGARIGPYKLLQKIGEGGFGVVFMAEQQAPVVRRVALKIIKAGMDTRQVIARFEAERQALAMMDHPGIARVFDAGATDTGRPYFVMELVRGEPVTQFCERERLDLPRRLELFQEVCHAVQHAHQKGIIHRDLKPANILVADVDGRPTPKVIDFGIAKAIGGAGAPLTDKTLFTDFHQFLGTPEYMPPEQVGMGIVDADTRSDIYSLGVLLYELITGGPPFDPKRLRSAAWEEMRRIIREEEPPRPSTRLGHRPARASEAAHGPAMPDRPVSAVRGDLDWIVMKCLEKDRARRYETANGLAMDIHRHLAGDAVLAAPPSTIYRVRKLLRRHRAKAAVGLAVGLSLLAAVTGTTTFAVREAHQRRLADQRAKETAQVARFQASMISNIPLDQMGASMRQDLFDEAESGWRYAKLSEAQIAANREQLKSLLAHANLTNTAVKSLDRNLFERALADLDRQFSDQPLLRAGMLQNLSNAMVSLTLPDRATRPQTEALEIREQHLGAKHLDTLASLQGMGDLLAAKFRFEEAEGFLRRAVEGRRHALGEDDPATLESLAALANVVQRQWRLEEAEPLRREVLAARRKRLGEDHPLTLQARIEMGRLLLWQGRVAQAEEHLVAALRDGERVLGPADHSLMGFSPLALIRQAQGRFAEAEELCTQSLGQRRAALGDTNRNTLFMLSRFGGLLEAQGRLREAEDCWRKALRERLRGFGDDDIETLCAADALGAVLLRQGRLDEGESLVRDAFERRGRVLAKDHPEQARSLWSMGLLLQLRGKPQEARPYLDRAFAARRERGGYLALDTLQWFPTASALLQAEGRLEDAETLLREDVGDRARLIGRDNPGYIAAVARLASFLADSGRFVDAERELLATYPSLATEESLHREAREAATALVKLYEQWMLADPSGGHASQAAQWRARLESVPAPATQPR